MNNSNELVLWLNFNPHQDKAAAKVYSDRILHQLLHDACPESAPFTLKRNENGKPYCDGPLFFSYSHSRTVYLYGIDKRGPIGVDLETTHKKRDVMTLVQRFFHQDEAAHMKTLAITEQTDFFYKLWSRKEACCKLFGGVLWYYLSQSVLATQFIDKDLKKIVYLTDIDCVAGYVGAVATIQPIEKLWINTLK